MAVQDDLAEQGEFDKMVRDARAGALVTFEGWVRDHHDGRTVTRLKYEAFDEMAISTGNAILEEARKRFAILKARVVHRVGEVGIGERAIWVGVTAEHRQEAFLACRWIMDRIKQDVPIWKQETYAGDADSVWVIAGEGSGQAASDYEAGGQLQNLQHQQDEDE